MLAACTAALSGAQCRGRARQARGAGASETACRTALGVGFHGAQGALAGAGPRCQAAYQAVMLALQQARPALPRACRPCPNVPATSHQLDARGWGVTHEAAALDSCTCSSAVGQQGWTHPAFRRAALDRHAHSVAPRQALPAQHEMPAPGCAEGAAHSCADPASPPPGSAADGHIMPLLPAGAHAAPAARASSADSALTLLQPGAGAPAYPAGLLHAWSVRGALREASGDELFAGDGMQRPAQHQHERVSQRAMS